MLSVASIAEFFKDDCKVLKRGELHFNAGDVVHFVVDGYTIRAQVQASMRGRYIDKQW